LEMLDGGISDDVSLSLQSYDSKNTYFVPWSYSGNYRVCASSQGFIIFPPVYQIS